METDIEISWTLSESKCWDSEGAERINASTQVRSQKKLYPCRHDGHIILDELKLNDNTKSALPVESAEAQKTKTDGIKQPVEHPVVEISKDGIYIFQLTITQPAQKPFLAKIHIEIRATYGYLSAIDWPLLLVSRKRPSLPTLID